MNALTAPIALVDDERQIVVVGRDGRFVPLTRPEVGRGLWDALTPSASDTSEWATVDRTQPLPRAGDAAENTSTWSWPTWSPDGRQIACFRFGKGEDAGHSTFVDVLDIDGLRASELTDLKGRLPVYLQWHEQGRDIALLSQREERLVLSAVRPAEPGVEAILADGSPLFFSWLSGRPRVAAFVGNASGGHLGIYDPRTHAATLVLPGQPGNFCTPVTLRDPTIDADRVLYVAFHEGRTVILAGTPGSAETRVYEPVEGLVALVPSPDRQRLARSIAPAGDGTPYRGLAVIDLTSGTVTPVSDRPCLAFLWVPDGSGFVTAHVDTDRNLLVWSKVPLNGEPELLIEMYPSRDLGFFLRFFEQYADSHPLIDPTGQFLLLSGVIPGRDERSRIWQVRLSDGRAEAVADGLFGVYGPSGD